jgi:eukaryotic-like serine/threonine-protein kinase
MAERTVVFVSDGRCTHCGGKHEPWAVVCPVSRKPITPASRPRNVIPPSPAIPQRVPLPRAQQPAIPRSPAVPLAATSRGPAAMDVPSARLPLVRAPARPPAAPRFGAPPEPIAPAPPAGGVTKRAPSVGEGASLVGRVIGDRYGMSSVIGEGGMGVVYEAEHLTIGKLVAVKVLHPSKAQNKEAVSRLRREARVAGTLGHPNICAVYDMGRLDNGSPYIVMERLHGETLAERIARLKRLAVPDMVDIMLQVLSALAAAHQRGVVHRDLKPDNIFLSQRQGMRPVPKLLDFGISKAEDIEDTVADPTGAIVAAGTPFYMAPEQARGDRAIDWRIDLWAAGVILHEGLSGRRPFDANNYNALLVQILSARHRPIRDIDPALSVGLERVVDKALSKRPDERYQSALEFQGALRSYKELEQEAPSKPIPILVSETTDDGDATTVFHRVNMAYAAPSSEEEPTPIYGSGAEDDERTVVEAPAFLREMASTPSDPDPRRKR